MCVRECVCACVWLPSLPPLPQPLFSLPWRALWDFAGAKANEMCVKIKNDKSCQIKITHTRSHTSTAASFAKSPAYKMAPTSQSQSPSPRTKTQFQPHSQFQQQQQQQVENCNFSWFISFASFVSFFLSPLLVNCECFTGQWYESWPSTLINILEKRLLKMPTQIRSHCRICA